LRSKPHDLAARARYRGCCSRWRQQLRQYDIQAENKIIAANNLGAFYKYVNTRISYRAGIGALSDSAGSIVVDNEQKANIFNEYFASVGTVDTSHLSVHELLVMITLILML